MLIWHCPSRCLGNLKAQSQVLPVPLCHRSLLPVTHPVLGQRKCWTDHIHRNQDTRHSRSSRNHSPRNHSHNRASS